MVEAEEAEEEAGPPLALVPACEQGEEAVVAVAGEAAEVPSLVRAPEPEEAEEAVEEEVAAELRTQVLAQQLLPPLLHPKPLPVQPLVRHCSYWESAAG